MREEVLVLPASSQRSKAGFCVGKTEEAIFNASRNCTGSDMIYVRRSSHVAGLRRDSKAEGEVNASEFVSAEKMETEVLRGERHCIALEKHEGEVSSKQTMRTLVPFSLSQMQQEPLQGALLLQWGISKRTRCSRGPNNQNKLCPLVEESEKMGVLAVKDPSVILNSSAVILEKNLNYENTIAKKRDCPYSASAFAAEHADLEEDWRREKRLRSSESAEGKRGVPVHASTSCSMQDSQQTRQQQGYLPKTRSSLGKRVASPEKYPAGKNLSLHKFTISLSRKEIEEDFLMFKGSKLGKRLRRRPRIAEKAVLYCTPGTWLSDVSYFRYNVKEKKCVKEKPRGLKEMQSYDSDSE